VYESSDLEATWLTYTQRYEEILQKGELPKALQLQTMVTELPQMGKVLALLATWADADHDEGRRWFDRVAELGSCVMNTAQPVSLHKFTVDNEKIVVWPSYGRVYTISIRCWTPATARVLAKYGSLLPGGGTAISTHALRSPNSSEDSVFGSRVDHHMIEAIATSGDQSYEEKAASWAVAMLHELKEKDPANILEGSYISLLGSDDTDLVKVYGSHYSALLNLKKKYDPHNVFKHAVPKLPV
jgi:hypothetical protein